MATQLTKNFTLEELCHSNTAKAKGIINLPGEAEKANLYILADKLLQPVRDLSGGLIIVSSGFRNSVVNKLAGGAANSQHLTGKAADISSAKMRARELFNLIINSGLEFDQVILYDDGRNNFVHVSYNKGNNRRQALYSKGTKK
jgi:hypothetical protein